MKDYKMPITDKHQIPNILDHAELKGYYVDPMSRRYLLTAENLVFNTHTGVRQCDNRIYDDLQDEYKEISQKEFIEL